MSTLTSLAKKAAAASTSGAAAGKSGTSAKSAGFSRKSTVAPANGPVANAGQKRTVAEAPVAAPAKVKPEQRAGEALLAAKVDDDWETVTLDEIAVVPRKEGKKKQTKGIQVIRRTRGKDGKLMPADAGKQRLFTYQLPPMKVGYTSDLNMEGNLGKGEPPATRMKAKYYLRLLAASLDGHPRPDLHEKQVACVKKTYLIGRHILGLVFDANDKEWAHHIGEAMAATRKELMRDHGFTKPKQLEDKEAQDPKLRAEVLAAARTYFIDHASSIPGGQRDEEEGYGELEDEEALSIALKKKVWPLKNYDPAKDALSNETGLSYVKVPSNLANWPQILQEMTEKHRTEYCEIKYCYASGKTLPRPPFVLPDGTEMPDPSWNPCIVDRNGVAQEALVAVSGTWSIYHTGAMKGKHYGVRLDLNPIICVINRVARRTRTIVVDDEDAEEFEDELIEPVKPVAKKRRVQETKQEDKEDGEVDEEKKEVDEDKKQEGDENDGEPNANADEAEVENDEETNQHENEQGNPEADEEGGGDNNDGDIDIE